MTRLITILGLVLLLLAAACGEDADMDGAPNVSGVDGGQVLDRAADRLAALDSYTASSTISGAREGAGRCVFRQPDLTYCAVGNNESGEADDPESEIFRGKRNWVRSQATGESWTQAGTLRTGYEGIILSDVGATVQAVEGTVLDDTPAYKLDVSLDLEKTLQLMLNAETAADILPNAGSQSSATGSVWVDAQTGLPLQDVVTLQVGDAFELTWQMDYGGFDEAASVPTPLGEPMLSLVDSYSEHMRAGELDAATALFPEDNEGRLRAELQSLMAPPYDSLLAPYDSLTLESLAETSLEAFDTAVSGQGRVAYADGVAGTFDVTMVQIEGGWRLFDVHFTREQGALTDPDSALGTAVSAVLDEFMVLAEEKAYEDLYDRFSTRVQAELTLADLEAFIDTVYADWHSGYDSLQIDRLQEANTVTIQEEEVQGTFVSVQGQTLYEDGRENQFNALLEQEAGEWTIANIFMTPLDND